MEDTETLQEQGENTKKDKYAHLKPWQFKPGQSGNPKGRPPGPSLKEYAKKYLSSLTEEERLEYLAGIDKKIVWEMAEGKARQETEVTGHLTIGEALDQLEDENRRGF